MTADTAREYLRRRISPAERFEDLLAFPRFLEIETVRACNARCRMCPVHADGRPPRVMAARLFAKLAAEIADHAAQVRRVSLYKDGEPLLDPNLAERVAQLKAGGVGDVTISTNVSLLTPARGRELLTAGLDTVILSIDSIERSTYEAIRIGLDFEQVMANARRFIELRNRIRPRARIWLRMVRQRDNFDQWEAYRRYWQKRLAPHDRVNYHALHNWGGQLNQAPVAPTWQARLPCVALWSQMVVFADGAVPNCTVDYRRRYPNGDAGQEPLATLWHSAAIQRRRALHIGGRKAEMAICRSCNVWDDPPDRENLSARYADASDPANRGGGEPVMAR